MKRFLTAAAAAAVMLCCSAFSAAAADSPAEAEPPAVSEQELADISECGISFKYASYSYTGSRITPDNRNGADEVTVTLNGETLVKGQDYVISYQNNIDVGYRTALLTVTGTGSYTGSKETAFTIKPAKAALQSISTSNGNIRAAWDEVPYALGYQILYSRDPSFANDYHSLTVTGKTDAYLPDVSKAGEKWYVKVRAFITDDGTVDGVRYGSYSSVKSITVKGKIVSVKTQYQKYTYKGSEIIPKVIVTDSKGNELTENDYTVSCADNLNVGTAAVTVKGNGSYSGSFTTNFTIKPNDLCDNRATIPALEYIYPGSPVKPTPTLKVNGIKLTRNTDYYVTYSNNNAVGTATVTLTGLGNFSGTTFRTYSIVKAAAGTSTVKGTTYYADRNGNVERSITNGVISYSDKYMNTYAKKVLTKKGYTTRSSLPSVDIDTISRGVSQRKIDITWKPFLDSQYSSYVLLRGTADGKSWTFLKEIAASGAQDHIYTDDISSKDSRFFRYALGGVTVISGVKYVSPLTYDAGWAKIKICLDPGHYIGANSNSEYSEGTQMLLLGGKLKDSLTQTKLSGSAFASVKITRTGDGITETFSPGVLSELKTGMGTALASRGKYSKGCDYFISLHSNATSTNSWNTPSFWEVQCYVNKFSNNSTFERQLAYDLGLAASKTISPGGKTVDSRSPFSDRLVIHRQITSDGETYKKGDTYYAVTRAADKVGVPGVLIEHSFHTNPEVRKWLLSDSNLAKLAKAESTAILAHYGFPMEK